MLAAISGAAHAQTKPTGTINVTPAGTLTINEGDAAGGSLSVKLSAAPNADVTVSLAKTNTDVTLSSSSLTFTTSNWNTAQTVTVIAAPDNDGTDDTDAITFSATGGITASNVTKLVTITDDDKEEFYLTATTLFLTAGGSGTFGVRLGTRPSTNVTVTVTASNSSKLTIDTDPETSGNQGTLSFTQYGQTNAMVAVVAARDYDQNDGSLAITLTGMGGNYQGKTAIVTVTYAPSGTINVTPSETLIINEGDSGAFSVGLSTAPISDVTVTLTKTNADVTLSPASLTFTTSNWNTAQTVTVTGAPDTDATTETHSITLSARGGIAAQNVTKAVTIIDTESTPAHECVETRRSSFSQPENPSGAHLLFRNTCTEAITVYSKRTSGGSCSGSATDNLLRLGDDIPSIYLSALPAKICAEYSSSTHQANSGYQSCGSLPTDCGTSGITVVAPGSSISGAINVTPAETLTINEGDSATLGVSLSAQPSTDVTVSLAKTNTDVTLSSSSLTFTTSNWNTAQTVTVIAAPDNDGTDDTDAITFSATGGITASNVTKLVTITDDDKEEFYLTATTLFLTAGGSGTFGVRLGTRPSTNVTVTVTASNSSKLTIDTDPETSGNQGTLSFTQYGQTNAMVAVVAARDYDQNDGSLAITLTGMGGNYQGKTAIVTVTYAPSGTINVTPSETLIINEGDSGAFSVGLSTAPISDVTVTLTKTNADVTLSPASLTFTTSNWNTAQTVTVTGAPDTDATTETHSITLSARGGIAAQNVTKAVTIIDTESTPAHECVETRRSSFSQPENPSGAHLLFRNTCTEAITVYSKRTSGGSCSGSATDNLLRLGDDIPSIYLSALPAKICAEYSSSTHQANSGYQSCGSLPTDCGTSGITVVAPGTTSPLGTIQVTPAGTLTINEGASTNLSVSLSAAPTSDVRVTLTELANTGVTVIDTDTGMAGNQNTLTFTTTNWSTAQSVTVSAVEDDDATDDTATIRLNASGGGYANATGSVMVNVPDDDEVKLNLSTATLPVTEGSNATFTVSLDSVPSGDVTVTLTQPSNTDVTVDTNTSAANNQNTLTFTASNWSAAQTVTVSAAEDDDATDDTATIGLSASGGGYVNATGNVTITITDTTTPTGTINVSPTGTLTIGEGALSTLSVSLSTQPNADVTVSLAKTNTDVTLSPASLTFTTSNWNTSQNITVSAAQDADSTNDTDTITLSATGGITASNVTKAVAITDNDTPGLTINPDTLNITEGGSGNFTVSLTTQPSENVTVTIAQPSNTDITVDTDSGTSGNQNTLTFTTGNYNTAQSVTVNVAEDADTANDNATLNITASGADYTSVTGNVTISATDNDTPGLTINPDTLNITEGGNNSFSVSLTTPPSENVTVTIAQPSNTDITVDTDSGTSGNQTTLTFTTGNYNTAQSVTVNVAEDADTANDNATLNITASGADYTSVTGSVAISATDNDSPGLTINPDTLSITEGGSSNFTVSLTTPPSENVTVTIAQPSNTDITVDTDSGTSGNQNTLSFTTGNYNTAQNVTVNVAEDADTANDNATLNITASGADYTSVTGSVTISATDTTTPTGTINVTPAGTLTIGEGASGNLSVSLSAQPASDVTVTLAKTNADVTLSASTLTFTTGNWNTSQNVTVTAGQDADTTDDTDTITLSASGGITAPNITRAVTVTDNDTSSPFGGTIGVNPETITVREGDTINIAITLSEAPTADVTLTSTIAGTSPFEEITLSVSNITTSNWNNDITLSIEAAQDSDYEDETGTILLEIEGNNGDVLASTRLSIAVEDDDTPPAGNIPTFGDQTQADLNLTQGVAITPVTLPAASGGDGALQYRISPSLPAGLRFNAVTREISGTPVTLGTTSHTLIASDSDNDTGAEDQASLGFNIGIRVSRDTATRQATQAWLSRFGRGVGEQAIQGIRKRIQQPITTGPQPGAAQLQTRLGGHSIDLNQPLSTTAAGLLKQLDQLDRSNLLHGSRFSASGKSGAGQIGIWGQGAYSDFAGEDNNIALDGKLRSLLLGSDYRRDNWAAGILLSRSNAEGDYRGEIITGELESDLTGVVPWGSIQMSEELSVWGAMGQGRGELQLKPVNESGIKTDLDWQMLAGGMQSRLIEAGERNRMGLSFTGDLLWTETTTDRVAMLQAVAGEMRRVRLGLEADWRSRGGLTPRLELGIRHDSGDAETGLGVELGGGLTWRDGQGNRFEVNGRSLLTHDDSDSRDWGLSIVAQHDARPSSHRGFSMRLSHELGGRASGGLARLLSEDLLSADNTAADYRWELELAYGIARARGLTGSGYTALSGGAGSGMGWRVGYRLQPEHTPAFEVDLHALDVREADEVDPGVGLNFIWR